MLSEVIRERSNNQKLTWSTQLIFIFSYINFKKLQLVSARLEINLERLIFEIDYADHFLFTIICMVCFRLCF